MTTMTSRAPVGELLRQWRERRRLSQLEAFYPADAATAAALRPPG